MAKPVSESLLEQMAYMKRELGEEPDTIWLNNDEYEALVKEIQGTYDTSSHPLYFYGILVLRIGEDVPHELLK